MIVLAWMAGIVLVIGGVIVAIGRLFRTPPCPECGGEAWRSDYSGITTCQNDDCAWDSLEDDAKRNRHRAAAKSRRSALP